MWNGIEPGVWFVVGLMRIILPLHILYIFGIFWLGMLIGWEKPLFQLGVQPFLFAELFKILIILLSVSKLKKLTQYFK